jgi:hypothetical protein
VSPRYAVSGAWPFLLVLVSCTKPSSDELRPDAAAPPPSAPFAPGPAAGSADAPGSAAGPILTPEDVEVETEQRITEQNLESELDRLEREIQAE